MRRTYIYLTIVVIGIIGTAYGTHLLIYNFSNNKGLSIPALVLLIVGVIFLFLFIGLAISQALFYKRKKKEQPVEQKLEEVKVEEPAKVEDTPKKVDAPKQSVKKEYEYTPKSKNSEPVRSSYSYSTTYVKKVGYGPILRLSGNRILDMRSNTYYRIEDNFVYIEGSGLVFEIRGNQIRDAFGGYQYEISGSNINKVFGGFYASISGNYITLYDLSDKYEMTDSLNKKQLLVVAMLLFGKY